MYLVCQPNITLVYILNLFEDNLRCKKQSYLKQRRQNSVWNECIVCSRGTDFALGPSMLGVHSGGNVLGSADSFSNNSRYL